MKNRSVPFHLLLKNTVKIATMMLLVSFWQPLIAHPQTKEIAVLIQNLKNPNPQIRYNAARALGNSRDSKAIEPLLSALKDEDSSVRKEVISSLRNLFNLHIKDQRATEPLIAALKDENSDVRKEAASALRHIGTRAAIEALIGALKDDNGPVRSAAAYALGEITASAALEPLIDALKDDDAGVRRAAAYSLWLIFGRLNLKSPRAVDSLIITLGDEHSEVRERAALALGALKDPRGVEPLIVALKDQNPSVRGAAVVALGSLRDLRAVEPLIRLRNDKASYVRRSAMEVLGKMGIPRETEAWIADLEDKGSNVRDIAIEALGALKDSRAVQPLVAALKDKDWFIRRTAAGALGNIKDSHAVPHLIAVLKDENSDVRSSAAKALGNLEDSRAVESLFSALKDKDSFVRKESAKALNSIIGASKDKTTIPRLIPLLANWDTAGDIADVLTNLGWEPGTKEELIHYLVAKRNREALREKWSDTKAVLLNDVRSRNSTLIENALFAFIGIGKEEILYELRTILENEGTKTMAEAYLNSGNEVLRTAAKNWALAHGYSITTGAGTAPVRWGGM